jgi:hypothetical protein
MHPDHEHHTPSVSVLQEEVTPCCDNLGLTYRRSRHFLCPCCVEYTTTPSHTNRPEITKRPNHRSFTGPNRLLLRMMVVGTDHTYGMDQCGCWFFAWISEIIRLSLAYGAPIGEHLLLFHQPTAAHNLGAIIRVTPYVVSGFLYCVVRVLCCVCNIYLKYWETKTDTRVTSVTATYQQRITAKPYVPSIAYGRSTLGAIGVPNKFFV